MLVSSNLSCDFRKPRYKFLIEQFIWESHDILMGGLSFTSPISSPPIRISHDTQNKLFNNCNIKVNIYHFIECSIYIKEKTYHLMECSIYIKVKSYPLMECPIHIKVKTYHIMECSISMHVPIKVNTYHLMECSLSVKVSCVLCAFLCLVYWTQEWYCVKEYTW